MSVLRSILKYQLQDKSNYNKAKFCIKNIDADQKFIYLKTSNTFTETDLCSDTFKKGVLKFEL